MVGTPVKPKLPDASQGLTLPAVLFKSSRQACVFNSLAEHRHSGLNFLSQSRHLVSAIEQIKK
jgi:hypothetical protein